MNCKACLLSLPSYPSHNLPAAACALLSSLPPPPHASTLTHTLPQPQPQSDACCCPRLCAAGCAVPELNHGHLCSRPARNSRGQGGGGRRRRGSGWWLVIICCCNLCTCKAEEQGQVSAQGGWIGWIGRCEGRQLACVSLGVEGGQGLLLWVRQSICRQRMQHNVTQLYMPLQLLTNKFKCPPLSFSLHPLLPLCVNTQPTKHPGVVVVLLVAALPCPSVSWPGWCSSSSLEGWSTTGE